MSKPIDEFVERNVCVKQWLEERERRSSKTSGIYKHLIYHYYLWLKENTDFQDMQALLEDFKAKKRENEEYFHIDLVKRYVLNDRMKLKSKAHRNQVLSCIKAFYESNNCALPKKKIDLTVRDVDTQRIREGLGLKPMTLTDLEQLVKPMKIREKAVLTIMLQSGLGVGEFCNEFNICKCREDWLRNGNNHVCEPSKVMKQIREGTHPVKIQIAIRKSNTNPYYTFIGRDGVETLKRYMSFRGLLIQRAQDTLKKLEEKERRGLKLQERELKTINNFREKLQNLTPEWSHKQPIFITNQLNPISEGVIQTFVKNYKRLTGLIDRHFTPHTCRDTFKTECAHAGVDNTISEFFIGHSLDQYGYNQLDKLHPEDFVREYLKVEPALNIISHTGRPIVSANDMKVLQVENLSLKGRLEYLESVVEMLSEALTPEQIKQLGQRQQRQKTTLHLPKT